MRRARWAMMVVTAVPATILGQSPRDARLEQVVDSVRALPAEQPIVVAMVRGNPGADTGRVEMLIRLMPGAWIPPHRHNVPKQVRVLDGKLLMGHGGTLDSTAVVPVASGSTAEVPADHAHYEGARGLTIILIVARAPFRTSFVR